ncbi:Nanos-like protein 2 [Frankliniella fusca]|uniref:Nanos-like protein 2 n=1 Tax=Frankliniella fusca TaxID=407009 RepID=A0AAE1H563_9NEOP|nr:Nanos-like protein 2 [Frankliniella fusca]
MDPFRYHDMKEGMHPLPLLQSNEIDDCTPTHRVLKTETHSAGPGRFLITSLVETLPTLPRPIQGPDEWRGGRLRSQSSVASSPPTSSLSVSSSPPSSIVESGFSRRNSECRETKPYCSFCKKNGERPSIYNSHQLKSFNSNGECIVECFVLRSVRCPICGATGDYAHTISHCPKSSSRMPVALALKSTPRQCDGTLRRWPCY